MEYNVTYGDLVDDPVVVDLPAAKANSNIDTADQDTLLQILLEAAVDDAENYTGTSIRKRNVTIEFESWARIYDLPHYPLQSITSLSYLDSDGAEQTLQASDYKLYYKIGTQRLQIKLDTLPYVDGDADFPIKIEAVAGYDNDKMPGFVKSAVLLRFSHKEMFREDSAIPTSMDRSFQSALRPLKRW